MNTNAGKITKNSLDSLDSFLLEVKSQIQQLIRGNSTDILLEMALDHFKIPGKLLRPRIAYGLGEVFQLEPTSLAHWAASFEILHNATLVHDDIQDGDRLRRGKPTTWVSYGTPQAINLGDLLMLIAPQAIFTAELNPKLQMQLSQVFSKTAAMVVNGQSFELILNEMRNPGSLEQDYFKCISQKTSALFAGIAKGAALMAGLEEQQQNQVENLFLQIGNIFQVQDDILDLYGEKKRDAIGCDIREGKMSFLILTHLHHFKSDRQWICEILAKPRESTSSQDVESVLQLFETKKTLQLALQDLQKMLDKVHEHAILHELPRLLSFSSEILETLLQPIQHLRKT